MTILVFEENVVEFQTGFKFTLKELDFMNIGSLIT